MATPGCVLCNCPGHPKSRSTAISTNEKGKRVIDFAKSLLQVPGHPPEPIEDWRVWFVTIEGTHPDLEAAKASCERTGQPVYAIIPVAVACGKTQYEIRQ